MDLMRDSLVLWGDLLLSLSATPQAKKSRELRSGELGGNLPENLSILANFRPNWEHGKLHYSKTTGMISDFLTPFCMYSLRLQKSITVKSHQVTLISRNQFFSLKNGKFLLIFCPNWQHGALCYSKTTGPIFDFQRVFCTYLQGLQKT